MIIITDRAWEPITCESSEFGIKFHYTPENTSVIKDHKKYDGAYLWCNFDYAASVHKCCKAILKVRQQCYYPATTFFSASPEIKDIKRLASTAAHFLGLYSPKYDSYIHAAYRKIENIGNKK